jgi:hypothetical protein
VDVIASLPLSTADETIPVPRSLLVRLWLAPTGAALFLTIATIHGAITPGYDAGHQAVSALSIAPRGWIQTLNFVLLGATLLSTMPTWRLILAGGKAATWYPALTAIVGASLIATGFVPQDPAPGYDPSGLALTTSTLMGLTHLALAAVVAFASVASLFVMAARLAGDRHWGGWAALTCATAALTIACVAVYGVWSTRSTGLAGTFERGAIILPMLWGIAFLTRLWSGTPFMRSHAA